MKVGDVGIVYQTGERTLCEQVTTNELDLIWQTISEWRKREWFYGNRPVLVVRVKEIKPKFAAKQYDYYLDIGRADLIYGNK